jgi:transcriptional regulator with XRE-family HTH domain
MLGDAIRRQRQSAGLSMREASRRIGISPAYLVELEHGRNPTTGRAPMPSPTVLAGIGRALDIDLATLLDLAGVPARRSAHMLLVQAGGGRHSARAAARRAVTATVDTWIEIAGRGDPARALRAAADTVSGAPNAGRGRRLGLVFDASPNVLRGPEGRDAALASERTWEEDVAAVCRAAVGTEPAANVCVYREADIRGAGAAESLATAIELIRAHPHVVFQGRDGGLSAGPAAIEAILAALRPAAVGADAWAALVAAAAVGLHRQTAAV